MPDGLGGEAYAKVLVDWLTDYSKAIAGTKNLTKQLEQSGTSATKLTTRMKDAIEKTIKWSETSGILGKVFTGLDDRQMRWIARDLMRISYLIKSVADTFGSAARGMADWSGEMAEHFGKLEMSTARLSLAIGDRLGPMLDASVGRFYEFLANLLEASPALANVAALFIFLGQTVGGAIAMFIQALSTVMLLQYGMFMLMGSEAGARMEILALAAGTDKYSAAAKKALANMEKMQVRLGKMKTAAIGAGAALIGLVGMMTLLSVYQQVTEEGFFEESHTLSEWAMLLLTAGTGVLEFGILLAWLLKALGLTGTSLAVVGAKLAALEVSIPLGAIASFLGFLGEIAAYAAIFIGVFLALEPIFETLFKTIRDLAEGTASWEKVNEHFVGAWKRNIEDIKGILRFLGLLKEEQEETMGAGPAGPVRGPRGAGPRGVGQRGAELVDTLFANLGQTIVKEEKKGRREAAFNTGTLLRPSQGYFDWVMEVLDPFIAGFAFPEFPSLKDIEMNVEEAVSWIVKGAEWWAGKLVQGAEWWVGKAVQGAEWFAGKVVQAAEWWAGKVVQGAEWWTGKIVEGATYWSGQIVQAAQYWSGQAVQGAQWFSGEVVKGAQWFSGETVKGAIWFAGEIEKGAIWAWQKLTEGGQAVWDKLTLGGQEIWNKVTGGGQELWNKITSGGQQVWDKLSSAGQRVWDKLSEAGTNFWDTIVGAGNKMLEIISGLFKTVTTLVIPFANISITAATVTGLSTKAPEMQGGGYIPETGAYMLHAGERVIPQGEAGGASYTFNISNPIIRSEADIESLARRISDMMELRRRRAWV